MAYMVNGTMVIAGPAEDVQRLMDETTTVVKEEGEHKWPTIVPEKIVTPEGRKGDRPETYGLECDEAGNPMEVNEDGTSVKFDMISINSAPLYLFDYLFESYPTLKGEYFFDNYEDCSAFLFGFDDEEDFGFGDYIEVNETYEGRVNFKNWSSEEKDLGKQAYEARSNEEVRKMYRAEWVGGDNTYQPKGEYKMFRKLEER